MKDQNNKHLISLLYCSYTYYYSNLCCHFPTTITERSTSTKQIMTIIEMFTTSITLCFTRIVGKAMIIIIIGKWKRAWQNKQNTGVVLPVCLKIKQVTTTLQHSVHYDKGVIIARSEDYNNLSFHVHLNTKKLRIITVLIFYLLYCVTDKPGFRKTKNKNKD